MIASERHSFWDLFLSAMEDSLLLFAQFDCPKYLRYGTLFLEQMKSLEYTYPELYQRYFMGQWAIHEQAGFF